MKLIFNIVMMILCLPFLIFAEASLYTNQVGYLPRAEKYVFSSGPADSFSVFDKNGGVPVFTGQLSAFLSIDTNTGLTLYTGDFSNLQTPGTYYITAPGMINSAPFTIADSVFLPLYRKALKAFYYQRCGMDLLGPVAGDYFHTRCHTTDAVFHSSTGKTTFHLAGGGWHDAGDYGKYSVNAGITVATLLMAYEYFPEKFQYDNLNIPESGNRIPDILDEVRYELEWLLKMQDSSGGVHHKLTREQFSPFIMPQNDKETRYIYRISSAATADFAAVFSRAARVFGPFDKDFAETCLSAADLAWTYLETHPNIVPAGGFTNPDGTHTGSYGDGNDTDERLWAAAELFESTGQSRFHEYYKNYYAQSGLITATMWWQNVRALAHLTYMNSLQPSADAAVQAALKNSLLDYAENLLNKSRSTGFYVTLEPGEYDWGCNSQVLNHAILLIMAYEKSGSPDFKQAALDQLNYILGINAHRFCFVTGMGSRSPLYPHHRPSGADGKLPPVPGLLVGGPNQFLQDPVLQTHFNSQTPPALCYIDDQESYASNEIAINWNAPLVFAAGYFCETEQSIQIERNESRIQLRMDLKQNYPNPFNSWTTFNLYLNRADRVVLKICDVNGKNVFEEDFGVVPRGELTFRWNAMDRMGNPLPSGIYFYYLESPSISQMRKLVYLK